MTAGGGSERHDRAEPSAPNEVSAASSNRSLLVLRGVLALLAITPLVPWYRSFALVEQETYLGNPLPWVDWMLAALAIGAVIWPRLSGGVAVFGLLHLGSACLLMFVDAAEGLRVEILPGIPFTAVVLTALWLARTKLRSARLDESP